MARGLEVTRFRVHDGAEEAFVKGRPAAMDALRREFPALEHERLARGDGGVWIHVLEWESLDAARRAQEGAWAIPEVAAWFGHMSELVGMEHGELGD